MKLRLVIPLFFIFQISFGQTDLDRQITDANQSFQNGLFSEAFEKFRDLHKSNPNHLGIQYKVAELNVLSNQFAAATSTLDEILNEHPGDSLASRLLAETYYRQDQFDQMPALLRASNQQSRVDQIEHFTQNNLQPYLIEKRYKKITIKMETIDFLPSVKMKVNGKEALFIIDTGGGETILDTDFASEVKALSFDQKEAVYAGGTRAKTTFGFVERLELGSLTIKNVPIHIQNTKAFSQAVGGRPVAGVIGTNLLYHFISTLDYQSGELVLYKKGNNPKYKNADEVPFWLASDHLILALGTIKDGEDQLFLVDTGMAGAGFTSPKSTLDAANIEIPNTGGFEGQGGGGKVSVTPFMIEKLSLGNLKNKSQIVGLYGAFPPSLENQLGFRIGGLISHAFFRPYKITFDFDKMMIYAEN